MARKTFRGCRLTYTVYSDDIFSGWSESDRYSASRSASRYGSILENRLRKAFPGAEVEVEVLHGVGGAGSGAKVSCDGSDYRHDDWLREDARELAGRLYESHRSWLRRK